jgi:hypothetical protein|tara:strand:- start:3354 stop:4241 length:888 start_codon:yes stop_codon:yes gene_type:complete
MNTKKRIEVGLDVRDPINLYSNENNIEYVIREKYAGVCFKGCYIITVDKILRTSDCVINQEVNDGSGTVAVIFEATVLVYSPGDIVTGCVVKRIDKKSNIMVCETDIAFVMLRRTNIFESIVIGQIITVVVGTSKYSPGSAKIAINSLPFIPSHPTQYIVLPAVPHPDDYLESSIAAARAAEDEVSSLIDTKQWKVFSGMITMAQPKLPTVSIYDDLVADTVVSNVHPLPLRVQITTIDETRPVVTAPANEVSLYLIQQYTQYLLCIRDFIKTYSTPQLINSHKNLWAIYASRKK